MSYREETEQMNVRLPKTIVRAARGLAKQKGISLATVIKAALLEVKDKELPLYRIKKNRGRPLV